VIGAGARPTTPSIPGIDGVPYLTSNTALELDHPPGSLLVVGAGYIGAELAQLFARAGVAVTVVSRRGLLAEGESEIAEALTQYLSDEGVRFVSAIAYERIERTAAGVRLHAPPGVMRRQPKVPGAHPRLSLRS
jgi:mercuric reductase